MSGSRLERLAPLTGAVFAALLVAGTLVIGNFDFLPPGDEIKSFFEDDSTRILGGSYLTILSVAFFLWFLGSLRASLRVAEGGTGRLSAVAFGAGIAIAATILVATTAAWAGAVRGGEEGGIAVETATALFDFWGVLMGVALPIGYAVLLGAAAVISFRTGVFARWLTWTTAVLAVALLIPGINYALTGFAIIWVVIVIILLYTARSRSQPKESA